MINGVWISDPNMIKSKVYNFFAAKFHEHYPIKHKFINSNFKQLSTGQSTYLESAFTIPEIKSAVWCYGGEKALGPNEYSFKIIKAKWDIIKEDVIKFVKQFESTGSLAPGCNSSFITLIPKIYDPLSLVDYRPFSLIGCLYKVVAKLLANRLKRVIGSVVDKVQSAYSRQIHS